MRLNKLVMCIFSLFLGLVGLPQKVFALGIDATVEKYFSPFSDKFSEVL